MASAPATIPARAQPRPAAGSAASPWLQRIGRWVAILVLAVIFGFPLYWTVTMSFKPQDEWNPPGKVYWVPQQPDGLATTPTSSASRGRRAGSSATARASALPYHQEQPDRRQPRGTALALLVGVFAAYGIGRFRAGGRLLPFQILQLRMFPPIAIIIPLLFMWVYLGLVGHAGGLVILYAAVTFPFVVWLMRSFFQEVPREIVGGGDRRRLHAVGRVLQGGAAAGEGRPRRDGALRLHPELERLPDRARDDAGQGEDGAGVPAVPAVGVVRPGVRQAGGARAAS